MSTLLSILAHCQNLVAGRRPILSPRSLAWAIPVSLLVLCLFLFFFRLADRDLWSSHEARAAQDAQSILDNGIGQLPHLFDGHRELQKPPLYYWTVAGIAWLRGGPVDALAVRMPTALAGMLTVLAVSFFGWKLGRPLVGVAAAASLATMQHFTWLARTGRIDIPLTLTVTVTLLAYYLAWRCRSAGGPAWPWLVLAYLAVAAGILLKGPIGLVLPAVVIGIHLLVDGESPAPWRPCCWLGLSHQLGLWWGLPLVLCLTLPWFLWADTVTDGEFSRTFFWYHNVERGLGSDILQARPWWRYGPQLLWDALPWSPLLPVAGWVLWRQRRWPIDAEARFGLVWLLTMTGFLSLMSFKRADYLLPAYPGAALFLGCAAEWLPQSRRRWLAGFAAVAFLIAPLAWWFHIVHVLPSWEPQREQRTFAAAIRQLAPQPQPVLFFRAECHALAFHLGRPVNTFLEWENLDVWASRPGYHIVMPPEMATKWHQHVTSGRLEVVLRNNDLTPDGRHDEPLILVRTVPLDGTDPCRTCRNDRRSPPNR